MRQAWIGHACTYGNGYLEIEWDDAGRYPRRLHTMDPRHTRPVRRDDGSIWYEDDRGGEHSRGLLLRQARLRK